MVFLWAQSPSAPRDYKLYTAKGKPTSYKALLTKALQADVIFFGELHDNSIAHQLQYALLQDLIQTRGNQVILGLEMFERDQQEVLLAYQRRDIPHVEALAEKTRVWPNFLPDYAPLVEKARQHGVAIYGTNAPRDLAKAVSREGLSTLDGIAPAQKAWLAPLPLPRLDNLPTYQAMTEMAQQHGLHPENFRLAQMLKDATMAYTVLQTLQPGHVYLHINGSYHSDYEEGIVAYLRYYWGPKVAKKKKVLVISTVPLTEGETYQPESRKRADFILVVPPTSYTQTP
jgi:uncharacterized iron-regulated protein